MRKEKTEMLRRSCQMFLSRHIHVPGRGFIDMLAFLLLQYSLLSFCILGLLLEVSPICLRIGSLQCILILLVMFLPVS